MRSYEIFSRLNPEERIILYAVGALDRPLRSKVKLQKLLFLVSNVFDDINELMRFEPHFLGPYSEVIVSVTEQLETLGLIQKETEGYTLTPMGAEVFARLRPVPQLVSVMADFKELLNDLNDNDVLTFIYACYPQYTKESLLWEDLQKNRMRVAVSLLRKGKLSTGRAAQVAGLGEADFIATLNEPRTRRG